MCGIKWRKFVGIERPNTSVDPLEDPILKSYSRCLDMNILCVWRRVESPRQDPDPNSTGGMFDSMTASSVHPPLSLTAAKELWLFWFGEEPELSGAVDSQLLKQGGKWKNQFFLFCFFTLWKNVTVVTFFLFFSLLVILVVCCFPSLVYGDSQSVGLSFLRVRRITL